MLAVKLHNSRRPYLNVGSHLMPFIEAGQGRSVLGAWARLLIRGQFIGRDCNISLVKISDDVRIFLGYDLVHSKILGIHPKAPYFKEELERYAKPLSDWDKSCLLKMSHCPECSEDRMDYKCSHPEILLAEEVSQSYVKWTKRYQLWKRRK